MKYAMLLFVVLFFIFVGLLFSEHRIHFKSSEPAKVLTVKIVNIEACSVQGYFITLEREDTHERISVGRKTLLGKVGDEFGFSSADWRDEG
jgi:predicted Kef-type K+ transport protein